MDYLAQSERDMQSLISRIAHNRNCRIIVGFKNPTYL